MARGFRAQARDVLELHRAGQHEEALARGMELAHANPGSALALNLVGSLHRHSGGAAWDARASDDDKAASALELHHHYLALDAFSAAAQIAPDCVMTAIAHAEALATCGQLAEAPVGLFRIFSMAEANHTDPAVHHVGYDLVLGGSNAKTRKRDAVYKANVVMQDFEAMVNNEIVPIEAAKMLGGDVAVDQVRQRARLVSQSYPYSARAQLLCVYVELEHVRALNLPADKKRHLRRILPLISDAAVTFDCSLLIALFHAKVLFVLDEFDQSERECRRALRIEKPTDPNLDDIPPAVSVPGADYDSRVSYLQKQFRVFLKNIIVVAALYWPSIKGSQHHARIISVKVDTLQAHFNRIDPSAAKTISDAHRYLKKHNSWSFLICPNSRCDGRKFMDTESLCRHMRSKHRDELWKNLESILGPHLNENASKNDNSLDGITLWQDSGQNDIFSLPRVQDMFESLLLSPSVGIEAEPLVEMRRRKCREGAEVLEDIKEKLKMLPEDVLSTEFEEFRFGIQNLWLKFLENSLLDYREVILPLSRSFQWIEIKQWIARNVNDSNRSIGDANIDAVSDKIPVAPDHQSGDNLQPEKLKTSCADVALKADEKCEEMYKIYNPIVLSCSEFRVVNNYSGTMVDQSSSNPAVDVDESVTNNAARITEVEQDKKGTSGQSVKEGAMTSSYQQSINVLNKNNVDKDLPILSLIIRSLGKLGDLRDKLLTEPLVWIPSGVSPCIAHKFYEVLSSWEKNNHDLPDAALPYMKNLLSGIVDFTTLDEKAGTDFSSEKCSGEYVYTTLFHKLDAGSSQTTKIKSFAEILVRLDEQFCKDNNCDANKSESLDEANHCCDAPSGFKQQIFVNVSGTCVSLQKDLNKTTVKILAESALERVKVKTMDFYCTHSGKCLSNEKLLNCYPIQRNSTINMHHRLRAGRSQTIQCSDWNRVIQGVRHHFVRINLPPQLQDKTRNITSALFLSPPIQGLATEVLIAMCEIHRRGFSLNGAFNASHILWYKKCCFFDTAIREVVFDDASGRNDLSSIHNVFQPVFDAGNHGTALFTDNLLAFLLACPAGTDLRSPAVVAFLTNHFSLLSYAERIAACHLLHGMIKRIYGPEARRLLNATGIPDLKPASDVPALKTVLTFKSTIHPVTKKIQLKYTTDGKSFVRLSSNFFKHAPNQFHLEDLDAAFSAAMAQENYIVNMLQCMATLSHPLPNPPVDVAKVCGKELLN